MFAAGDERPFTATATALVPTAGSRRLAAEESAAAAAQRRRAKGAAAKRAWNAKAKARARRLAAAKSRRPASAGPSSLAQKLVDDAMPSNVPAVARLIDGSASPATRRPQSAHPRVQHGLAGRGGGAGVAQRGGAQSPRAAADAEAPAPAGMSREEVRQAIQEIAGRSGSVQVSVPRHQHRAMEAFGDAGKPATPRDAAAAELEAALRSPPKEETRDKAVASTAMGRVTAGVGRPPRSPRPSSRRGQAARRQAKEPTTPTAPPRARARRGSVVRGAYDAYIASEEARHKAVGSIRQGTLKLSIPGATGLSALVPKVSRSTLDLIVRVSVVWDLPPEELGSALTAARTLSTSKLPVGAVPYGVKGAGLDEEGANEAIDESPRKSSPTVAEAIDGAFFKVGAPAASRDPDLNKEIPGYEPRARHGRRLDQEVYRQLLDKAERGAVPKTSLESHGTTEPSWDFSPHFRCYKLSRATALRVTVLNTAVEDGQPPEEIGYGWVRFGEKVYRDALTSLGSDAPPPVTVRRVNVKLHPFRPLRRNTDLKGVAPTACVVWSYEPDRDPLAVAGSELLHSIGVGPENPLATLPAEDRRRLAEAARTRGTVGQDLMAQLPVLQPLFMHVADCYASSSERRAWKSGTTAAAGATKQVPSVQAHRHAGLEEFEFVGILAAITTTPRSTLSQLFRRLDANGDGTLTWDEYVQALLQQADNHIEDMQAQGSFIVSPPNPEPEAGGQSAVVRGGIKQMLSVPELGGNLVITQNGSLQIWDDHLRPAIVFEVDSKQVPPLHVLPFVDPPKACGRLEPASAKDLNAVVAQAADIASGVRVQRRRPSAVATTSLAAAKAAVAVKAAVHTTSLRQTRDVSADIDKALMDKLGGQKSYAGWTRAFGVAPGAAPQGRGRRSRSHPSAPSSTTGGGGWLNAPDLESPLGFLESEAMATTESVRAAAAIVADAVGIDVHVEASDGPLPSGVDATAVGKAGEELKIERDRAAPTSSSPAAVALDTSRGLLLSAGRNRVVQVFDVSRHFPSSTLPIEELVTRRLQNQRRNADLSGTERLARAMRTLLTSKDGFTPAEEEVLSHRVSDIATGLEAPVLVPTACFGTGPGVPSSLCVVGADVADVGRVNDDRLYAVGDGSGYISLHRRGDFSRVGIIRAHNGGISKLLSVPRLGLVAAGLDGRLTASDLRRAQVVREFVGHTRGVTLAEWSSWERYMLTSSFDETCLIWDPRSRNPAGKLEVMANQFGEHIVGLALNDMLNQIAVAKSNTEVQLFDVRTLRSLQAVADDEQEFLSGVQYDRRRMGLLTYGSSARLWPLVGAPGNRVTPEDAAWDAVAKRATYTQSEALEGNRSHKPKPGAPPKRANAPRLKAAAELVRHLAAVQDEFVAIDEQEDPRALVAALYAKEFAKIVGVRRGGAVSVWSAWNGELELSFVAKPDEVELDRNDRSEVVVHHSRMTRAHAVVVTAATLDASGRRLVVGASDGSIAMFNFSNGVCLRHMPSLSVEITALAFHPAAGVTQPLIAGAWGGRVATFADADPDEIAAPPATTTGSSSASTASPRAPSEAAALELSSHRAVPPRLPAKVENAGHARTRPPSRPRGGWTAELYDPAVAGSGTLGAAQRRSSPRPSTRRDSTADGGGATSTPDGSVVRVSVCPPPTDVPEYRRVKAAKQASPRKDQPASIGDAIVAQSGDDDDGADHRAIDVLCVAVWGGTGEVHTKLQGSREALSRDGNREALIQRLVTAQSARPAEGMATAAAHALPSVAAGTSDGRVIVWTAGSAKPSAVIRAVGPPRTVADDSVEQLLPLPTLRSLVVGTNSGNLLLVSLKTNKVVAAEPGRRRDGMRGRFPMPAADPVAAGKLPVSAIACSGGAGSDLVVCCGFATGYLALFVAPSVSTLAFCLMQPAHEWRAHGNTVSSVQVVSPAASSLHDPSDDCFVSAGGLNVRIWNRRGESMATLEPTGLAKPVSWPEELAHVRPQAVVDAEAAARAAAKAAGARRDPHAPTDAPSPDADADAADDAPVAAKAPGAAAKAQAPFRPYHETNPPFESKTVQPFSLRSDRVQLFFLEDNGHRRRQRAETAAERAAREEKEAEQRERERELREAAHMEWSVYTRADGRLTVKSRALRESAAERLEKKLAEIEKRLDDASAAARKQPAPPPRERHSRSARGRRSSLLTASRRARTASTATRGRRRSTAGEAADVDAETKQ